MATLSPGMPFRTTSVAPPRVRVVPTSSRHVSRSPRKSGERRIREMGSTVMRRAALVAVDRAMPQLAKAKAAAKPRTPIQPTRHRSGHESRAAGGGERDGDGGADGEAGHGERGGAHAVLEHDAGRHVARAVDGIGEEEDEVRGRHPGECTQTRSRRPWSSRPRWKRGESTSET